MKKQVTLWVVAVLILMGGCLPKPYFQTREGKKKQRHYNSIQFGQERNNKNFK